MTELVLTNATVTRDRHVVLDDVTVRFGAGELVALLGANGAGKSTLVRAALGLININSGQATIDAIDSRKITARSRALKVAYLPQKRRLSWPLTVEDTVLLGRYAHGVRLGHVGSRDRQAIQNALNSCDLDHLAHRRIDQLSGGELARVHCARAFAGEAPMLVADEPIAELDPWHQFQLMKMIRKYVDRGHGAVVIVHDPELAARFADRLVWMVDGRIIDDGPAMNTLTAHQLARVYGMEADVFWRDNEAQVTLIGPIQQPRPLSQT